MKYLIWHNNDDHEKDKGKLLNVLLTNRTFAEIFEGNNPLYPIDEVIKMHQKEYGITKFERADDMVEVGTVNTV